MALKSKLILLMTMAALALCVIIAGVYAAAQQKISMQGAINIVVDDQTMYLRDVRIQHGMSQTPTTVEGFRKGYINTDFQLDLSESDLGTSSTGTFILYFDVVNLIVGSQTSEYLAEASWTGSEVGGASFSIDHDSRMIDEGTVAPTAFTDSTPLSGTIILEVNVFSGTSFDLSNITITIREPQQISTDLSFTTDDAAMTATVYGNNTFATGIIIPRSFSVRSSGDSTTYWEGNDYTVTNIGYRAFRDYSSLASVIIPDSVTTISNEAFRNCGGLTSINIPPSVTTIGFGAFVYCNGLTGPLTIPSGVTSIGNNAFQGCSGFTGTLTIPDSVTSIGSMVFYKCSGLNSIKIPESVTSIGNNAFNGCSGLTGTITIPSSVTSIGSSAFYNCTNLTTINIPDGVTSIGTRAFYGCDSLTSITVKATTPPSLGSSDVIPSNVTNIYVPAGSVNAYKAATGWSDYADKISAIM